MNAGELRRRLETMPPDKDIVLIDMDLTVSPIALMHNVMYNKKTRHALPCLCKEDPIPEGYELVAAIY